MKCPKSNEMVFSADLPGLLHVTPAGHHLRIGPDMRMDYTFDNAEYTTVDIPDVAKDPLKFKDDLTRHGGGRRPYLCGGICCGSQVTISRLHGGGRGADARRRAKPYANAAHNNRCPRNARVQEMREAGLPYIVVLCDPTTGGVTASYAMLGDIQLAEPGALICFAGPRVIEETIREKLPEGFQRAEFLEEKGMIDRVVARKDMRKTLAQLLAVLMQTEHENLFEDA